MILQALCIISKPLVNSDWSYSPETLNSGKNWRCLCPVWPWNFKDDLEQGTSSVTLQALCIISYPSVKSELEFRSRKAQIWLKVLLSSLTLPFDLWPWLFAWTSLLSMIITSENFMMIRWHKQRKSCDGQTDGWTEPFIELLGRSLKKQGQSEGFDSCDRPSNTNQVGFKSTIFWPRMIFKFDGWPQKIIGHLFYATSSFACASFHSH